MSGIDHLILMFINAFFLSIFLYILMRLKPWLGLTPLFVTLGSLQFIQVILAMSLYIEIFPGLLISPGSSVFFVGTILGVLLVYIVNDALSARKLIYSLLIANVFLSFTTISISQHFLGDDIHLLIDLPREIFLQHPRVMIVGTFALFIDTILVIIIYDLMANIKFLFLRILITLSLVLILDSIIFITGAFIESENYLNILLSNLTGKLLTAPFFALGIITAEKIIKRQSISETKTIKDFFNLLTYREKYELAKKDSLNDPLTQLYNRRALKIDLENWNFYSNYSVLMIDIDKFKSINDKFGHQIGDRVLKQVSKIIISSIRLNDRIYRYGGEEFLVFLPETKINEAKLVAENLRLKIKNSFLERPLEDKRIVSVTIGIAELNNNLDSNSIINIADKRLYQGKNDGRDRVIFK